MKTHLIQVLFMTLATFTTYAADLTTPKTTAREEISKDFASTKTTNPADKIKTQHYTYQDLEDIPPSCTAQDIEKAAQGDDLSYKKILSFQMQLFMMIIKINQSYQTLTEAQEDIKNSEELKYANWEEIKTYYDSYATTRKLASISRSKTDQLKDCIRQVQETSELQKSISESIDFFMISIQINQSK